MTRAIKASEVGLRSHWKVRVHLAGGILHLASWEKPRPVFDQGMLANVTAKWIEDPDYGDTLGYIDWNKATAVTWRWSE